MSEWEEVPLKKTAKQSPSKQGGWEEVPLKKAAKPAWQEEPGLEPVGLLESFVAPVKGYAMALPAMQAIKRYAGPKASEIAGSLLPKTGGEMVGQAGLAGTAGVAGELASRAVPEEKKQYRPAVRTGTELASSLGLGYGTSALGKQLGSIGRGPTPAIPKERIEAARKLQAIGGKPTPGQISLGAEGAPMRGRATLQQGVANQEYNKAVGLAPADKPMNASFGKREFDEAKRQSSQDYNEILTGKTVRFDDEFFNNVEQALRGQQSLTESGIAFGQSRAIIGALEKIGGIPAILQKKINKLPRIGEEEATAEQSKQALTVLNELIPTLRSQGQVEMPATAYNEIRSILGDAAARTANDRSARALRNLQSTFDRAADRSLPGDAAALEQVRRRYEALKTLEEAQLSTGTEMGIISAEQVGKAIQRRVAQGAIYGNNNPLRHIGEQGMALGMQDPAQARRLGQEMSRGNTPTSTMWALGRDALNIPIYPIRAAVGKRRISDMPAPPTSPVLPTGAAALSEPERQQ